MKDETKVGLAGGLLKEPSPNGNKEKKSTMRFNIGLGSSYLLQPIVGQVQGREDWFVFTIKPMMEFMDHFLEDHKLEHKEEQFPDSYFVEFEKEKLFRYEERDICHVGGESRKVGLTREEFICGIERNWKQRKRKIKKTIVDCNLEDKVASKEGGMLDI
ncbi:unnamed protein product [Linum trigynum]|uniref:Uncharacterized protein n=1 Tax=Linum trigynum TaxID=586398 RepID=A0AAV2GLC3_9ROSI